MNSSFGIRIFLAGCLTVLSSTALSKSSDTPPDCSQVAGALPSPTVAAGTPNPQIPVDHILVIMQENHSFDDYFGRLNQTQYYGSDVDGITDTMTNPSPTGGAPVAAHHETNLCLADTDHSWNAIHEEWDNGKNDDFVWYNGDRTMAYYDQTQIGYYYALANQFAIADRYFCGALTSTYPNRFFLYAGTAFGHIKNDSPSGTTQFSQKTIFDELDQYGVTWKYYTDDIGYLSLFQPMYKHDQAKMGKVADYQSDLANGTLPQVVFLDASFEGQDEHPAADVTIGEGWVASIINALMQSSSWNTSALFLTYDEAGGFFDHVAPPAACVPDDIPPALVAGSVPGAYDRYGFRVPFILVSPFAKHHYVSHNVYSHTSILRFIEARYNLPALTARDANSDSMLDLFNFTSPVYPVQALPVVPVSTTTCVPTQG